MLLFHVHLVMLVYYITIFKGCRTLGVLTKPDLVEEDKEKEAVETARNRGPKTLEKGYTTVKCRTQKNINSCMSLDEAVKVSN